MIPSPPEGRRWSCSGRKHSLLRSARQRFHSPEAMVRMAEGANRRAARAARSRGRMIAMRPLAALSIALALVVGVACSSDAGAERVPVLGSSAAATELTDWPMYHGDAAHTGYVESPAGSPLHQAWTADLKGAVY